MKISLSFDLTEVEMEALKDGMLSATELLREPLETLIGNDVDNILTKIPELFKETTVHKSKLGVSWLSTFNFIVHKQIRVTYVIQVDECVITQLASTSTYVVRDLVPVVNLYTQFIKVVTNFKFSQGASNSLKILTNKLKLKS